MSFMTLLTLSIVSAILVCCESGFVDTLPKCKAYDYECQKNVIQSVIQNIGTTGIPALDVYRIDSLDITGYHIPVYDLLDVTVTEGDVKGIKGCTVAKFITDFDHGHVSADIICDLLVKGKYRVSSYNPFVKIFLGTEAIHGEGSGQVKIEKFKISYVFPFDLVRRNNDLYINGQLGNLSVNFDVLGKVQFNADNDVARDQSSDILVRLFNDNWKLCMEFVSRIMRDVATRYIYEFTTIFYNNVPLKYFITEDFSTPIYG